MVQGKVNFIHLRATESRSKYGWGTQISAKGGATAAWRLEENGELTVFKPARCHSNEHYNKSEGRKEVLKNVEANEILGTVSFEELHKTMVKAYKEATQRLLIGPDAQKKLEEDFVVYAYHNLPAIASNRFYEQHVRCVLDDHGVRNAFN